MSRPADIKTQFLEFYNNHDIENLRLMAADLQYDTMHNVWSWTTFEWTDVIYLIHEHHHSGWNILLQMGCQHNLMSVVNVALTHGAGQWDWALASACNGGHINMAQLAITESINTGMHVAWNSALYSAAYGGHIHVVYWLMDKHANYLISETMLMGACIGGNIDIVNLFIGKLTVPVSSIDWNLAMQHGCAGGNSDIVQMTIQKGMLKPDYEFDWNEGLKDNYMQVMNLDVIHIMIEHGATNTDILSHEHIVALLNRTPTVAYFDTLEHKCPHASALFEHLHATRVWQHNALKKHLVNVLVPIVLEYVEHVNEL